jgi:Golgi nucleoside diphosphatase
LSKRILEIKNVRNRILWSNIYDIFNNINDFVLKNFIKHLEEHGMATYKLTRGIFNVISSIENLQSLLEQSWIYDKYDYSFTRVQISNKRGWLACYLKNNKKRICFG